MKAVEFYYTVQETSLLVRLHAKTIIQKLKAGEFGTGVCNLGSEQRPDYRIPASGLNAFIEARRIFSESQTIGITARTMGELRRKAA